MAAKDRADLLQGTLDMLILKAPGADARLRGRPAHHATG